MTSGPKPWPNRTTRSTKTSRPSNTRSQGLTVQDVTIAGYGQGRVAGTLLVPDGDAELPGIVIFHGYTGNRAAVFDAAAWALQGFVVFAIDIRGQTGFSTDPDADPRGHALGWMTQGIQSPDSYYYRRVYVDCVRAVRFVQSHPRVRADRVGCTGISQGGGLTLATTALEPTVALAHGRSSVPLRLPPRRPDRRPGRPGANHLRRNRRLLPSLIPTATTKPSSRSATSTWSTSPPASAAPPL